MRSFSELACRRTLIARPVVATDSAPSRSGCSTGRSVEFSLSRLGVGHALCDARRAAATERSLDESLHASKGPDRLPPALSFLLRELGERGDPRFHMCWL